MNVVIIGAGKLGYTLAQLLSDEQADVFVVDKDKNQLTAVAENLDVKTINKNGANPMIMDDPDINKADFFIAVTNSDEVNIVACILAKKYGIKHAVARIRDMQFVDTKKDYIKENFDIDFTVNPELIAADEIYRILTVPAALNVDDFAEGKIRLFEAKIQKKNSLANIPLKDLTLPEGVLAGLIYREQKMIIPHGNDSFQVHDDAYFIGFPKSIEKLSENFVRQDARKLERVLIIGAGRIAKTLAIHLKNAGVSLKIIEKNYERCVEIATILNNESIVIADVIVCLTEDDILNLMIALLAKKLGVKKTVVRVYRTEYVDLIEKSGVDIVISARLLSASKILAFVRRGEVSRVSILEGAKAEAVEVIVQKGSKVAGKKLMDVRLPKSCLVCACVRKNEATIPNGQTVLMPDDRVILFCLRGAKNEVVGWFTKGKTFF